MGTRAPRAARVRPVVESAVEQVSTRSAADRSCCRGSRSARQSHCPAAPPSNFRVPWPSRPPMRHSPHHVRQASRRAPGPPTCPYPAHVRVCPVTNKQEVRSGAARSCRWSSGRNRCTSPVIDCEGTTATSSSPNLDSPAGARHPSLARTGRRRAPPTRCRCPWSAGRHEAPVSASFTSSQIPPLRLATTGTRQPSPPETLPTSRQRMRGGTCRSLHEQRGLGTEPSIGHVHDPDCFQRSV